jgi:LDH2 family malate/lactate/ureidoglycolate dehydrogenase
METSTVEEIRIRDKTLRDFVAEILRSVGVPEAHARLVGDSLVAANLRGVDSHGVELLAGYVGQLRAGGVNASTAGGVISESGACLLFDGQNGLGQVVADRCVDHAVRLARSLGLGIVVTRNSRHFGAAAYWAEKMARRGCVGIVMTTAGPWVPPFGGKSRRLGTNPIAMAVPGGRWQLDMATTTVAHGKLVTAAAQHRDQIPLSWGYVDSEGNPTTDRRAAERGWSVPFGGYKGTGLAMMVEILAAGLSGGPMASAAPDGRNQSEPVQISHSFLAVDPGRFLQPGDFETRIGSLVDMIKSSEPIRGQDEVLTAGEPEWRTERLRLREGIPIPKSLWERLTSLAGQLKVVSPAPDAAS